MTTPPKKIPTDPNATDPVILERDKAKPEHEIDRYHVRALRTRYRLRLYDYLRANGDLEGAFETVARCVERVERDGRTVVEAENGRLTDDQMDEIHPARLSELAIECLDRNRLTKEQEGNSGSPAP